MANWLQKILPPPAPRSRDRNNLPANLRQGSLPTSSRISSGGGLPNASIIYGVAASALFVIALYFLLFTHKPLAGVLVMVLAACFLGFAMQFLKYPK